MTRSSLFLFLVDLLILWYSLIRRNFKVVIFQAYIDFFFSLIPTQQAFTLLIRLNQCRVVATLDNTGINTQLTAANLGANSAAGFTFGSRTFVAINDATAGFNEITDTIIEITGLTGTLGLGNFVIA